MTDGSRLSRFFDTSWHINCVYTVDHKILSWKARLARGGRRKTTRGIWRTADIGEKMHENRKGYLGKEKEPCH